MTKPDPTGITSFASLTPLEPRLLRDYKRRAVGEKNRLKESSGQLGSKTRSFCPSESKTARFQASLSSSRNHARSAFKRFFPPTGLRKTRISVAGEKVACFLNPLAELSCGGVPHQPA